MTISQAITEFEFHISPALSSSRPQTGVGTIADEVEQPPGDPRISGQPTGPPTA